MFLILTLIIYIDLDEDVSNDPQMLDRVLRDDKNGIEPKGFSRSYSSSVRVSTIRKEDGVREREKENIKILSLDS